MGCVDQTRIVLPPLPPPPAEGSLRCQPGFEEHRHPYLTKDGEVVCFTDAGQDIINNLDANVGEYTFQEWVSLTGAAPSSGGVRRGLPPSPTPSPTAAPSPSPSPSPANRSYLLDQFQEGMGRKLDTTSCGTLDVQCVKNEIGRYLGDQIHILKNNTPDDMKLKLDQFQDGMGRKLDTTTCGTVQCVKNKIREYLGDQIHILKQESEGLANT